MMDDQALPIEISKAIDRHDKANDRAVSMAGHGASDVALEITKGYVWKVAEAFKAALANVDNLNTETPKGALLALIGRLDPEVLALASLSPTLHAVAAGHVIQKMYEDVGMMIETEVWATGLREENPGLYTRIEQVCRRVSGSVTQRTVFAKKLADKSKSKYHREPWSRLVLEHLGNWACNVVVEAMPEVFTWVRLDSGLIMLGIQQEAYDKAHDAVVETILRYPVMQPRTTKPEPWTGFTLADPRFNTRAQFLRTGHKDVIAASKAAIANGTMKPALDAVTALQSVPWRINKRVYGVLRGCMLRSIEVEGLPTPADGLTLLTEDMETAERLIDEDRFYTVFNCDWRGRVYALPHFNFQREDRVRALFEFADGMPLGDDGLRWLQMHVANCGDFDKISKQSIGERIQWTIKNTARIQAMCEVPLKELWWTRADKPFLFLAACLELTAALDAGPTFVTRLPISFDGSCSGLQHLSCMTRDEQTGALVNLTNNDRPSDVYSVVADTVVERLKDDKDPLAAKTLTYLGDDQKKQRKLAKRNVMTYAYSSKKYGMSQQQQTDTMDELKKLVEKKKLPEHPFAPDHEGKYDKKGMYHPSKAARFVASHIFSAIEQSIHRPAMAMKFLQGIAKALAHETKPLRWTTPVGIPWVNRYHPRITRRLTLWLHDKGVNKPMRMVVAVGQEPEIDKEKAANGVAPNLVHALDASHLMLTVNRSVAEGIHSIATVHDSFGCLAPQAALFNELIRQELVRMYETHDVLCEVLEQASCDLTQHTRGRLPSVPEYGTLNLGEINDAQYAFA